MPDPSELTPEQLAACGKRMEAERREADAEDAWLFARQIGLLRDSDDAGEP